MKSDPTNPGHYADEGPLYFYGGPFSNFATSPFLALPKLEYTGLGRERAPFQDPVLFDTVEHWYAAHKASDMESFMQIADARSPGGAKASGWAITPRPEWEAVKYEVMVAGLVEKFKIESFRAVLLETGARPIAEDSPTDSVWGITEYSSWAAPPMLTGKNLLGLALMEVRALCKGIAPADARLKALQLQEETWPNHTSHDIGVPTAA